MDWITDEIAIDDLRDAQDAELLYREGVWTVLSLVGLFVGRSAASLGVERLEVFTLQDGPGDDLHRFGQAVDLLARLVAEAAPVLVQCWAGRSRSPAVVAGYLMRSKGLSAADAVSFIAARRSVSLHPEMAALIRQFEGAKGGDKGRE